MLRRLAASLISIATALVPTVSLASTGVELPVVARVGPWPAVSKLIVFQGRLWFANSVLWRNHNSADIHSYDPQTGRVRYERHLFSQDAGEPVVAGGRLYWPFEDDRFNLGWGHFMVTDGERWAAGLVPSARIFHVHAMAGHGTRLLAATSAWRAGLQVSSDAGRTWRMLYDHPTQERRVSRIVTLASAGRHTYAHLTGRAGTGLLRVDGDAVGPVAGWPEGRAITALAALDGRIFGLVSEAWGPSVWRADEAGVVLVSRLRDGSRLVHLAASEGSLWAVSAEAGGGRLWRSEDGREWAPVFTLSGGTPLEVAVLGGHAYVGGVGGDGTGVLWGPSPPAPNGPGAAVHPVPDTRPPIPAAVDWVAAGTELDRALLEPSSYVRHGRLLRDLVFRLAAAGPPASFFAGRLNGAPPGLTVSLIGGQVKVPAATLGRWILLWGMSLARRRGVPPHLLSQSWTAHPNASEKYFEAPPAALWAAAVSGQRDRRTVDAMIGRLGRSEDPAWLAGDVIGALTALTGRRFGYDTEAWRTWWTGAVAEWHE